MLSEVKSLIDSWPGAVALVDKGGEVKHANKAFHDLFETGFETNGLLWDIVGLPGNLAIVRRAWAGLESGSDAEPIEWVTATPSGEPLRLQAKVTPFKELEYAAFSIEDHSVEYELRLQIEENLAADEALIASLPVTLLRLDYQGSLVRSCDNAGFLEPGAPVEGFLWTLAMMSGLGEAICDAMGTARIEQRPVRFRHASDNRHADAVVTPCGMSDTLVVLHDVTDTVLLDRAQRDASERLRLLVEGSDNVLVLLDRDLCVSYASPSFVDVLAPDESSSIGRRLSDFACDRIAFATFVGGVLHEPDARARSVFQFRRGDGQAVELEVDVRNRLEDPLVGAVVVNAHDVSLLLSLQRELTRRMEDAEQLNVELAQQATTDAMTGLHNYFSFAEHFRQGIAEASRSGSHLSIMLIDIDNFKEVNDTLGHLVGDSVLKQAADKIRSVCRSSDVVARYGGDEFVVMLPETDEAGAQTIAETIRTTVEGTVVGGLELTVSVGTATLTGKSADASELLSRADTALYSSKRAGRNQVTVSPANDEAA